MSTSNPFAFSPVLIVDDDPDALYFIRRQFEKVRIPNPLITLIDAEDAVHFLEAALARRAFREEPLPCLGFVDLKMPGMDGCDFVAWVRRHADLDAMKLVMLSTSDRPSDIDRATASGADRYIVKYPKVDVFTDIVAAASAMLADLSIG